MHTPADTANLLAEIMNESGNLASVHECMDYATAARLCAVFPSHFPDAGPPRCPSCTSPQRLGDLVYARLGGFADRGAGLAELTGATNFQLYAKAVGKPVADIAAFLTTPEGAADSAVWYMVRFGCLGIADPLEWRRRVAGVRARPAIPIGWPNVQRLHAILARALGVTARRLTSAKRRAMPMPGRAATATAPAGIRWTATGSARSPRCRPSARRDRARCAAAQPPAARGR